MLHVMFPSPEWITFGGQYWLVGELRIKDLAYLYGLYVKANPHPLETLRQALPEEWIPRRDALLDCFREGRDWPATTNSPEFFAWLSTPEGTLRTTHRILSQFAPNQQFGETIAAVNDASVEELESLYRVAWGHDCQQDIVQLLGLGFVNGGGDGEDMTVGLHELAEALHMTYEQLGNYTLGQYGLACRKGKRAKAGTFTSNPAMLKRVKETLYGKE